ncbi:MAG TPA: hypothetical protein VK912_10120 [Longimicrobiales bacterium]|nr:hypothetical protein [Longimicrobiales bacterium]
MTGSAGAIHLQRDGRTVTVAAFDAPVQHMPKPQIARATALPHGQLERYLNGAGLGQL